MRGAMILAVALMAAGLARAAEPSGFHSDVAFPAAKPWTAEPRDDGGPLRFAVIGDRTGVARDGVFPQAMKQIGWLQPDFIIPVGDLIEGYTPDRAELNREWDGIGAMVAGSGRPFVYVPGNHDLSDPQAVQVWTERHGRPWYAFTYKKALFIVLDTENPPSPMTPQAAAGFHKMVDAMSADIDAGDKLVADTLGKRPPTAQIKDAHLGEDEVAFVKETLSRHPDAAWTFVFFHKPAWISDDPSWPRIEALLAPRRYTVFAGHLHYYSHERRGGHDYFMMATTGAIAHREGPGTMDHTLLVTMTPTGPAYANIRLNGLADADNDTGQIHALGH